MVPRVQSIADAAPLALCPAFDMAAMGEGGNDEGALAIHLATGAQCGLKDAFGL